MERFYQDLPKYMPFLSEIACNDWENFKLANPTTLAESNSLNWELPSLYRAAILSSQSQVNVDYQISTETQVLLEKETAVPKRLNTIVQYMHRQHNVLIIAFTRPVRQTDSELWFGKITESECLIKL